MTLRISQNFRALRRLTAASAALASALTFAGCGTNYRNTVIPQPTPGPPSQVESFAVAVTRASSTAAGEATIIDYSGDTILAQANVGIGPASFTEDANGSYGYTINSDYTLDNFWVTTTLQYKNLGFSSLPDVVTPAYAGMFSPSSGLWVADANNNVIDVLTGVPETFKYAIPVAPTPILTIGPSSGAQRNYAISQNNSTNSTLSYGVSCNTNAHSLTQTGEADGIEVSTYTISSKLPLGVCPVYALQSPDAKRVYVLNRGSDSITVINSQLNTLDDQCPLGCVNQAGQTYYSHPTLQLPTGSGPVYAEYNTATGQIVVANYDGGTISIIDVSLDEYGNDSATFGTIYTVPVGNNPASVTVLYSGTRAYAANQTDGTVSVVNMTSHTVEKTIAVEGHPWSVVSTENSSKGKVYVASPDSPYLTIIETDLDIVDTALLLQGGYVVDVRTSTQNGTSGNTNITSRIPGAGQPCYLPTSILGTITTSSCNEYTH